MDQRRVDWPRDLRDDELAAGWEGAQDFAWRFGMQLASRALGNDQQLIAAWQQFVQQFDPQVRMVLMATMYEAQAHQIRTLATWN